MAELIHSMITSPKVVYSTTLDSVSSARTRIERAFDPDAVRELKAESDHDLSVDGPNLAAQAIAAGLVDEYHLFMTTSVVGGGKRFFPDGVRPTGTSIIYPFPSPHRCRTVSPPSWQRTYTARA